MIRILLNSSSDCHSGDLFCNFYRLLENSTGFPPFRPPQTLYTHELDNYQTLEKKLAASGLFTEQRLQIGSTIGTTPGPACTA